MNALTEGNSAKLFCLKWIENYTQNKSDLKILDLGCGEALNFVHLLKNYVKISYVGVEPNKMSFEKAKRNLIGLNAELFNIKAHKLNNKITGQFDIITSFSVLEHVYDRYSYLQTAKKFLKSAGYFLINYDSGHFTSGDEKLKNSLRPIFAFFGIDKYYQSFVSENEFRTLIDKVGFKIIDEKFFNTKLKSIYKTVPEDKKSEFMDKWLEFEICMNNIGIEYDDSKALIFGTRNFVLVHK